VNQLEISPSSNVDFITLTAGCYFGCTKVESRPSSTHWISLAV